MTRRLTQLKKNSRNHDFTIFDTFKEHGVTIVVLCFFYLHFYYPVLGSGGEKLKHTK